MKGTSAIKSKFLGIVQLFHLMHIYSYGDPTMLRIFVYSLHTANIIVYFGFSHFRFVHFAQTEHTA